MKGLKNKEARKNAVVRVVEYNWCHHHMLLFVRHLLNNETQVPIPVFVGPSSPFFDPVSSLL